MGRSRCRVPLRSRYVRCCSVRIVEWLIELRKLRGNHDERKVSLPFPGLHDGPVDNGVSQIFAAIAPLTISVQEEKHWPWVRSVVVPGWYVDQEFPLVPPCRMADVGDTHELRWRRR